ncbi:acetylcholinesterase-like [Schistocerca serialis cubense]|uniref:acetylcholinesterase-like n=1 Tax=Schistocerca serialis cubense TaxID=2023355 RepID=UPI00214E16FE|nr:acetylcholinesterase-like [Schistocerca serialis cubense]XP_049958540.1 acetylcholinesterase-like [Schistocerca serialis cubense]
MHFPIAATLAIVGSVTLCKGEDVLVTVQQGTLRGSTATSVYNTSYSAFLGIPYAVPPTGKLRFLAPQPAGNWEGVRNATQYGNDCVQQDGSGSEDCLYLNVYVPGVPQEGANLPVMFYIYGGAFKTGSGSDQEYGPDFLVSYSVILVTVNYRLGQLGFLSTGDAVAPGNAGLKDQRLALTWVQRNIERFGGDPQQVTIFGHSAGALSTCYHFISPQSSGLFSRAIIQSSNFVVANPFSTTNARTHSFKLGAILGYETNDSQQLLDFLQSVNVTDLLVNDSLIQTDVEKKQVIHRPWEPNIEPDVEGAVVTESPNQMLIDGRFNNVPIMMGTVSAEIGTFPLQRPELIANLNEDFAAVIGPSLHLPTVEQQTEAAWKVKDFYFGNNTISADDPDTLIPFFEDFAWSDPNDAMIKKVVEVSNLTLHSYIFDYRGDIILTNPWGVSHAGELAILFLRKDTEYNLDPESEEDKVRRNMLRLWTNFAKYGNPTPEADPVVWQPYDLSSHSYFLMQANFSIAHDPYGERMAFWRENVPLMPFPDTI